MVAAAAFPIAKLGILVVKQVCLFFPQPHCQIKLITSISCLRYQNHWPTASPTEQKKVAFFETTFVYLWRNFFTGPTSRFE